MWMFFSRRLRMFLFFALAAPALSWLLGTIGDRIEARDGHSTTTSTILRRGGGWLRRKSRGPLAQPDQPQPGHPQ